MTSGPGATRVTTSAVHADDVDLYEADVVIVGAGPVGLMLACELRLGGVEPVVLERLPEISQIPKGNGLVGQIVPVLDYRGLFDRFRAQATWAGPIPRFSFGPLQLDYSRLGVSPLHVLTVPQRRLEELLGGRLAELGGAIRRGHELVALAQDEDAVTLDLRGPDGGYRLRAGYLVGCDGAHSLVRKQAGIGFPGVTSSETLRIGRVMLPTAKLIRRGTEVKVPGIGRLKLMTQVRTPSGVYSLGPTAALDKNAPAGAYIVYTNEDDNAVAEIGRDAPMTLDELRASARRVLGGDLPMTDPQLLTRLVGNSRQADRYRVGRILLAGDAAHVFGVGAGLNAGMLDAVNLGWKLAAAAQGRAPEGLLDTYHTERHLAGQRAMLYTRAQKALMAIGGKNGMSPEGADALRELFGDLLKQPDPLRHISELLRQPEQLRAVGELIEGSDVRYPMPASTASAQPHPLLGKLAPDLRLETRDGTTRVAELMHAARGVLLDLTGGSAVADAASDWVRPGRDWQLSVVTARCLAKPAPAAALFVRPDCYIAWAAAPDAPDPAAGMHEALRAWLGPPPPAG
jgi:2-polyprenyl-6-methoxyphenol hydroxylase-like FAD-dependent oxidoreductase